MEHALSAPPGAALVFPARFPFSVLSPCILLSTKRKNSSANSQNAFSLPPACVFVWFLQGCLAGGRAGGRDEKREGAPGPEGAPRIAAPLGRSQGPILGDRLCAYLYPRRSSARPNAGRPANRLYCLSPQLAKNHKKLFKLWWLASR